MLLLFNLKKFFFKCKLPLFALIKLKGNKFTSYYMYRMKNFNLVYKIKKNNYEKRCGGSSVNGICFNKIKFLKLLPSCKYVHPLQRSYLKCPLLKHELALAYFHPTSLNGYAWLYNKRFKRSLVSGPHYPLVFSILIHNLFCTSLKGKGQTCPMLLL